MAGSDPKSKALALQLLNSDAIRRMRFRFPSGSGEITINKKSFDLVRDAILDGTVTVLPYSGGQANEGGRYLDGNVLELRPASGRVGEALIVHELIHCILDLTSASILDANEEAACILAEVLYAKMTNLPDSRFKGPLFDAGRSVASGIRKAEGAGASSAPRVATSPFNALISAVVADDLYKDVLTASSSDYTHDG